MVDCGRVAMSNPLRQSLYTHQDCRGGGCPRQRPRLTPCDSSTPQWWGGATHADRPVGLIVVLVRGGSGVQDARAVSLTIPRPGHPVGPTEVPGVREECRQLAELVADHDVVFLGTDTRESRWLPTLLCSATNTVRGWGVGGKAGKIWNRKR